MVNRRQVLRTAGGAALGLGSGLFGVSRLAAFAAEAVDLPFGNGERPLVTYPGKRAMIGLTSRPPQLETPFAVFNESMLTPNDAFFVRYHLADIPLEIDPVAFRIEVKGKVVKPLSLSLDDLKTGFDPVELVAVHQCSGNSRGFFDPRVGGGQAGNGLMGNARWKGVPLKSILEKAGVSAGSVEVSFGGLDGPVIPETPDFAKSLKLDHALDGEVMLAYQMNGEDLPWLNGFPVRLVVPGFFGTYWVKHLNEITVLDTPLDNFWMKTAYRVPDNDCACVPAGTKPETTVPIGRFAVRSFITSVENGAKVAAGQPTALRGIAFDGGSGIAMVEVSADGGKTFAPAVLGEDLGKFSFREWTASVTLSAGDHALKVRATNVLNESQPMEATWNPSGYLRNVVETTRVVAA
ncbi:oxidase [Aureimonas sp. Leaf454]|jgi:sulfite dehydrogenase|uniref:SorA family sulfite dehydrogenase catalytic subunit n=1 Tax=Aureimonas sp. Leaf454 TaxID=1736381 RepID=UPI0006FFA175|nr:molybdopterin-dependent oxidoreductase [Aureimonas sp. Leaf454]KQT51156.1 oxidase [Aureimonas sp. Leaf454]